MEYAEKPPAATVVKSMCLTGKTFPVCGRMKRLADDGIPPERVVHVNFEDEKRMQSGKDDHEPSV